MKAKEALQPADVRVRADGGREAQSGAGEAGGGVGSPWSFSSNRLRSPIQAGSTRLPLKRDRQATALAFLV